MPRWGVSTRGGSYTLRFRGTTRRVVQCIIVASMLLATLVLTAPPSSAGKGCVPPMCSGTFNNSNDWAIAGLDWCGSGEWVLQDAPPGSSCGRDDWMWLDPGVMTTWYQDWDTFRIDAGCKYYWEVQSVFPWKDTVYWEWDLRGWYTHGWFRVHDDELAIITWQDCGGLSATATGTKNGSGTKSATGANQTRDRQVAPAPVVIKRVHPSVPAQKSGR